MPRSSWPNRNSDKAGDWFKAHQTAPGLTAIGGLVRSDLEALAARLEALRGTGQPEDVAEHPVSERCWLLMRAGAFGESPPHD